MHKKKFYSTAFIEAIKERPPIWMTKHPMRNRRSRLWMEVGNMFPHFTLEFLKKKWKNFKDTYRRELKKNPDPLFVQWQHYANLEFLKDEIISTSETMECSQNDSHMEFEHEIETHTDDFDDEIHNEDVKPLLQETRSPFESESASPQPSSSNTTRKRANPNELREEFLDVKKKFKSLEQEVSMPEETNQESKSGDYYFLMSILPEMEKLRPIQKLRFRNKINQALIDEMKTRCDD